MNEILLLVLLTLLPLLELRASIPYGIFSTDLHWMTVFLVCVVTNIILGPIIYFFLDKIVHVFLKIRVLDKLYRKYVTRTQRRIHKYVEKYGELGVALFIGIPLPGSGSYSGALGSYIIGLGYRKFIIANIIGVLIAGVIVTIISLTSNNMFYFFIKP
ncbi:small multi-drug export protein [Candidatus Woesearchaeota archaeon]|nr:small multi-drug export protein [Candidatus Woesearchaeota archaeon]